MTLITAVFKEFALRRKWNQGYILYKILWSAGKKLKLGVKGKKGERKKEENYIKKGGKGLKNSSFWATNSKKIVEEKI